MLTEEERNEIEAIMGHYPLAAAAGIEALRIVQRHRRWISDATLCEVAEFLGITPTELDAVATFYNLIFRQPVGRHVILVCDSVSCWIMGYDNLLEKLKSRLNVDLGQTTSDGRFTLLPHVCLGACDRAPVMMIDDQLYGELDADKIDAILANYA
ncbi:MAG: NADH-quinone oxidoreductase subunit NuoE [Desulfobacteraceae bacterium]|nr:MAG: NADH-quinone oxidoreductase subunit NuoE [Desulfobacteraceae bacterium]